jgi:hypothetical protein
VTCLCMTLGLGLHFFLSLSTSAMSLLYECVNTVIAGECTDCPARRWGGVNSACSLIATELGEGSVPPAGRSGEA